MKAQSAGTAPQPTGVWAPGFFHQLSGSEATSPQVGFDPNEWKTIPGTTPNTPPSPPSPPNSPAYTTSFNAVHACLIPDGPHRGEVLVWDGNVGSVRNFQPYSIVNPYWPNPSPFSSTPSQFRFHNGLLDLRIPGVAGTTSRGELFCGGKAWLPNGRLFVAGGTLAYGTATTPFVGTTDCWQFDPLSTALPAFPFGQWHLMAQSLTANRWYPSVILSGKQVQGSDYRVLIVGGVAPTSSNPADHMLDTYESARVSLSLSGTPFIAAFEQRPSTNLWGPPGRPSLFGGAITFDVGGLRPFFGEMNAYPRIHTLSTGEFFLSGEPTTCSAWSHDLMMSTTQLSPLTAPPLTPYDRTRGQLPPGFPTFIEEGVTLMLPNVNGVNDDMIRIGGAIDFGNGIYPNGVVETCSATTPGTWASGAPVTLHQLNHPRAKPNVTILPDASLLAVGGFETWTLNANGQPTNPTYNLIPERLVGVQWTDMAPMGGPRDYHSCSLLLPDGRVFTCGGEHRAFDYQIYSPPYLFGPDTRAVLASVTDSAGTLLPQSGTPALAYSSVDNKVTWANDLPAGIGINKVVLMRPAALTHHDDGGQRYFELSSAPAGRKARRFKAPTIGANGHPEVPPGWWMLFAVNNVGVPSVAYWINLQ